MKTAQLIVVGGFAGGGKTTLAQKLSKRYGLSVFSSDLINDAVRSVLDMNFHQASPTSHEVMWSVAKQQLLNGVSVIIDTPMCNPRSWQELDRLREQLPEVEVKVIILHADLSIHKARIDDRGRNNDEHLNLGGDLFEDIQYKYEFIENLKRTDVIKVDAGPKPDQVYAYVVTLLEKTDS